ncbi:hypothetical protein RND81_14G077300 [Saponaria officinalis]|uniref:tRNA-binding domain-containing protein n=1 Tax=Saponaria officinalis TaxID=3572 RepID=A0AAW1GJH2_SAPOF
MATNHLLKCGTTLLSSYHRTLTTTAVPAAPTTVKYLPISFLPPSLSLLPASRRRVRLHCTVSDTPVAAAAPPPPASEPPSPAAVLEAAGLLDIRVGKVVKAWRHPDADTLYVEEVDIGENEPRTICSGLVKFVPIDLLQDKKVVVLANLKPRNMRGVKSSGMLMAASDASHENVELLVPPEDSVPGERIWFGSDDEKANQPDAASANQIQKKKVWELVQPHLKTDAGRVAMLDGHYMMTSAGPVVSTSLTNANIS